jgi:ABC-type uncharacterized transport system substrate-binding protein
MLALVLLCTGKLFANGVSPMQLFFVLKQVFPEQSKAVIFITKDQFSELEEKINRAAAQNSLKLQVFIIESSAGIGSALNSMEQNSALVIFESDLLLSNTTKLYILSKCKEKQVAIITSSKNYSESGALLAVIKDQEDKPSLILNLKQNEHLKFVFTQELIDKIGFNEVIL